MMTLRRQRAGVLAASAAAALLNVNFLLEPLLPHSRRVPVVVISDLAGTGHPWAWTFRLGDALSAVLLLVVCGTYVSWRAGDDRSPPGVARSRLWDMAMIGVAVFAASTLVAALVAVTCTPAAETSCTAAFSTSVATVVHDGVSTLGTTFGIAASLLLSVATRHRRQQSVLHLTAFVLAGALGVVFIAAQTSGPADWSGSSQRAQVIVLSSWLVVVGWSLADRRTRSGTMPS